MSSATSVVCCSINLLAKSLILRRLWALTSILKQKKSNNTYSSIIRPIKRRFYQLSVSSTAQSLRLPCSIAGYGAFGGGGLIGFRWAFLLWYRSRAHHVNNEVRFVHNQITSHGNGKLRLQRQNFDVTTSRTRPG